MCEERAEWQVFNPPTTHTHTLTYLPSGEWPSATSTQEGLGVSQQGSCSLGAPTLKVKSMTVVRIISEEAGRRRHQHQIKVLVRRGKTETADLANLGLVQNIHLAELRLAVAARRDGELGLEVNTTSPSHMGWPADKTTGKQTLDPHAGL